MSGVSTEASFAAAGCGIIPSMIPNLPSSGPNLNLFPQPAVSASSAQPQAPVQQPQGTPGLAPAQGSLLNEASLAARNSAGNLSGAGGLPGQGGAPVVLDAGSDAGTAVFSDQASLSSQDSGLDGHMPGGNKAVAGGTGGGGTTTSNSAAAA